MAGEMKGQLFQPSVSKIGGLDAKYMILIAYFGAAVLGLIPGVRYVSWLIPLIIFLVDKDNKFIAFHAMQALLLEALATVVYIIVGIIAFAATVAAVASAGFFNPYGFGAGIGAVVVTGVIAVIVAIVIIIFAILAAVKGYRYEIYEIPLVGTWAEKIVFKTTG